MLIAQMTDIHIGFAPDAEAEELNLSRFRAALDRLIEAPDRPDMLVLTGDVTEHGDGESYARTAALLAGCPFPVWPTVGNHDDRENLLRAFPHVRAAEGGFVHYVLEQARLRIVLLDTFEPGRSGGAFCAARQAWLGARLTEAPDTPTVIFMHHLPAASGMDWMDPGPDEGWIARFGAAVEGHRQIRAIHCGHLHRPLATTFRGIPLHATPSVAPLVALDLRPTDPERPDGRALIALEPPAYALHRWDGANLVTHYVQVGDWPVMARYSERTQAMIREALADRAG
jgi:3',5'-cyclic AMP phosphodiesterase CpdA